MNVKTPTPRLFQLIQIPLQTLLLGFCLTQKGLLSQTLPIPPNLINLNSNEGETLLLESQAHQDYFPLSIHFETQENLAYCGVASITMVLNAFAIPAPVAPEFGTYHIFTQDNVLNDQTDRVVKADVVARKGMTLAQLGQLLETYPLHAKVYYTGDVSFEEFRSLAIKNLQEANNFILVNYLRKTMGQETGGHISPLAAYNQETDRFLILDVSRYKYPPVWVKAEELWQAMSTIDADSGQMRGFVLISPR